MRYLINVEYFTIPVKSAGKFFSHQTNFLREELSQIFELQTDENPGCCKNTKPISQNRTSKTPI